MEKTPDSYPDKTPLPAPGPDTGRPVGSDISPSPITPVEARDGASTPWASGDRGGELPRGVPRDAVVRAVGMAAQFGVSPAESQTGVPRGGETHMTGDERPGAGESAEESVEQSAEGPVGRPTDEPAGQSARGEADTQDPDDASADEPEQGAGGTPPDEPPTSKTAVGSPDEPNEPHGSYAGGLDTHEQEPEPRRPVDATPGPRDQKSWDASTGETDKKEIIHDERPVEDSDFLDSENPEESPAPESMSESRAAEDAQEPQEPQGSTVELPEWLTDDANVDPDVDSENPDVDAEAEAELIREMYEEYADAAERADAIAAEAERELSDAELRDFDDRTLEGLAVASMDMAEDMVLPPIDELTPQEALQACELWLGVVDVTHLAEERFQPDPTGEDIRPSYFAELHRSALENLRGLIDNLTEHGGAELQAVANAIRQETLLRGFDLYPLTGLEPPTDEEGGPTE